MTEIQGQKLSSPHVFRIVFALAGYVCRGMGAECDRISPGVVRAIPNG